MQLGNGIDYIVCFGIYIGVCSMILPAKEQIESLKHINCQSVTYRNIQDV